MSIVEPSAHPSTPPGAAKSDRLRVITAGHVGNMETRLGTSGFDIVAMAPTEEDLISALSADDADAIVVEADLCESLEHVRELAPDAVLIVVGNHTPAGALGRIERGVSGTVMAGLLHALVADGVGAAVIWGFLPAIRPTRQAGVVGRVGASLLSSKVEVAGTHIAHALQEHTGIIAAASAVVVTASASVLLTLGGPLGDAGSEPTRVADRVVEVVAHDGVATPSEPRAPVARRSTTQAADRAAQTPDPSARDDGAHDSSPNDARPASSPAPQETPTPTPAPQETPPPSPAPQEAPPPSPAPQEAPPPSPAPVETPAPPTNDATVPPGPAKGWDEQRPPKNDDNGNHTGWSNNSVPADPIPATAGPPPGVGTQAPGTQADASTSLEEPSAATTG